MKAGEQPALHCLQSQIMPRDWLPRKTVWPFARFLPQRLRWPALQLNEKTKISGLTNLLYTMQRTNLTSCILSIRWSLAPTTSGVDMTLADGWPAPPPLLAIQVSILVQ